MQTVTGNRTFLAVQYLFAAAFGGVFVYAGVLKVLEPVQFLMDIRSYQLIPDPWPGIVALVLPWIEILCGLSVILGVLYSGALFTLCTSLVVFLGAIISAWRRNLDISCGCFGADGEKVDYTELVVRDVILLAAGLFLLLTMRRWRPWWSFLRKRPPAAIENAA